MSVELKKGIVIGTIFIMISSVVLFNISMNAGAETPINDVNLEVYFSFDNHQLIDGSSYDVKDDSHNDRHGNFYNNPNYVSTTKFGRALRFNGGDDHVSALSVYCYISFTVEMWIYPETDGTEQYFTLFDNGADGPNHRRILLRCFDTGPDSGRLLSQFTGANFFSTITINWNEWNHIAYVYDEHLNEERYYINGEEAGTVTGDTHDCRIAGPYHIGRDYYVTRYSYLGLIDEFKIFSQALTPADGLGTCALKMGFEEGAGNTVFDRSGNNHVGTLHGNTDFVDYYNVLDMPFEEGTGTSTEDLSVWENDGTVGGAIWNTSGVSGNALTFDGSNDYVIVQKSISNDITGAFTVEAWINPQTGGSSQAIVDKYKIISGFENGFTFYITDGRIRLSIYSGSKGSGNVVGTTDLRPGNNWHHVMGKFDGKNIYVYADGELEGSAAWSNPPTSSDDILSIGKRGIPNTLPFKGTIDEVKIYSYQKKIDVNKHYRLNSGRCLKFDGSGDYVRVPDSSHLDINHEFTIEAWIKSIDKPVQSPEYQVIVDKYDQLSPYSKGYTFYLTNGLLRLSVYSGTINQGNVVGATDLRDNIWHHVKGVYDGSFVRVYIDGLEEAFSPFTADPAVHDIDLAIGDRIDSVNNMYFKGMIDDVRIYNYAKKEGNEILRMEMDESFWDGTNDEVKDFSGNALHGKKYNSAGTTSSGRYYRGGVFDGIDDYVQISGSSGLDLDHDFTIEAMIEAKGSTHNYHCIVDKYDDSGGIESGYTFYLTGGLLRFSLYSSNPPADIHGTSDLRDDGWHHVAVTYDGNRIILYVDGVEENSVAWSSWPNANSRSVTIGLRDRYDNLDFKGTIDNLIISDYARSFREDMDGDAMSDVYEIIRSRFSDQYDPYEYNGRYALLVAPVRPAEFGNVDSEIQYKYDITQMRYYLIANGWNDHDIIFLTTTDNHAVNFGFPTGTRTMTIGDRYNGAWIDGEAYHDNVDNAFGALQNGGAFTLDDDNGNAIGYSFANPTNRDIAFIEFRDHGSSIFEFCTYEHGDYSFNSANYWSHTDVNTELNEMEFEYLILLLDLCYSGGWVGTVSSVNRAIITSQNDINVSFRYDYLFYGRIRGDIETQYSDSGTITTESHFETLNADGVDGVDGGTDGRDHATPQPNSDDPPIRDSKYRDAIISVQEAHWFADAVCYDKHVTSQDPWENFDANIPEQIYI